MWCGLCNLVEGEVLQTVICLAALPSLDCLLDRVQACHFGIFLLDDLLVLGNLGCKVAFQFLSAFIVGHGETAGQFFLGLHEFLLVPVVLREFLGNVGAQRLVAVFNEDVECTHAEFKEFGSLQIIIDDEAGISGMLHCFPLDYYLTKI